MQVPSDQNISFDEKPEMKCHEITDLAVKALQSGKYRHVRCNFPNPDMVGHTGNLEATIQACTAVDKCVKVCFNAESMVQRSMQCLVIAELSWVPNSRFLCLHRG